MGRVYRSFSDASRRGERAFYRFIGATYVRSRYGVLLKADWDDATFNFCHFGDYGMALADVLRGVSSTFVFLDIGANQGLYSLLAARLPNCMMAIAFEPVARTFGLLQDNIVANRLEQKVVAIHAAVSHASGHADIKTQPGHSGAASLSPLATAPGREVVTLIDGQQLDALVPDSGRIVVKIDVEGHEEVVVAELMRSRHCDRIDAIFYEVLEPRTDPARIRSALAQRGFRNFIRHGIGGQYDMLALR
jgi:FkbM family methyltransferase